MSILQVHLELADKFPNINTFDDGEVAFQVNVENGENPIRFDAKRQHYFFNEDKYEDMKLEPYEIVHVYRDKNLEYGARKVGKGDQIRITFSQDEIYNKSGDLECYDKIFLILSEDEILPLANLNLTNWASKSFRYCESYIAFYESFTVTLWSGQTKAIHVPKVADRRFICNTSYVHYRLKFKSIPFRR